MKNPCKPLPADIVVAGKKKFLDLQSSGKDLFWIEQTPQEGRILTEIKKYNQQETKTLYSSDQKIGSQIHSYGGGALLCKDQHIFFIQNKDQAIYSLDLSGKTSLIFEQKQTSFSLCDYDPARNLLICLCQQHHASKPKLDKNYLVAIELNNQKMHILCEGADFYTAASLSPNGEKLCWIEWSFPHMPWDSTQLKIADLGNNFSFTQTTVISDGKSSSSMQPKWLSNTKLFYISDEESNWWNIYEYDLTSQIKRNVFAMEAEFGYPAWQSAFHSYDFIDSEYLVAIAHKNAKSFLVEIHLATNNITLLTEKFSDYGYHLYTNSNSIYFLASFIDQPENIVEFDRKSRKYKEITNSKLPSNELEKISLPKMMEFIAENDDQVYGYYYPPQSNTSSLPPLIIKCHGGPTAYATNSLDLKTQFWTSRGFAVFDVNYRGSLSFGRKYREALYGQMGLFDVEDCISAAQYCIDHDLADARQIFISGGSSGGYIALMALIQSDIFAAGAVYYGISDLRILAEETEKFEAEYFHQLIGEYPQEEQLYLERSPIDHIDKVNSNLIFFHGYDDKIVPINQTQKLVSALQEKNIKLETHYFEEEGHGFKKRETLIKCLEEEYNFYQTLLTETSAND